MYMFVFVTLIVAVIGMYTQVFNMQTTHMYAQQSGVAQAMLDWHATAAGLAQNAVSPAYYNGTTASACSLNNIWPLVATTPYCHAGGSNVYLTGSTGVTTATGMPLCSSTQGAPCYVTLPQGYGVNTGGITTSGFSFYSVVYQGGPTLQAYVLTFVPPPAQSGSVPGFVCLPGMLTPTACAGNGQQQIDITLSDLLIQLERRNTLMIGYGTVQGGSLVTPTVPGATNTTAPAPLSYPLPLGPGNTQIVPPGSIGIISAVTPCSSC